MRSLSRTIAFLRYRRVNSIKEGNVKFVFDDQCVAVKYDQLPFYRKRFQGVVCGSRAVDMLCITNDTSWMIEIKDYTAHPRTKPTDVSKEVAQKVRDTLAGLAAASANGDHKGKELADMALSRRRWRIVLHLERSKKYFSTTRSNIQIKLKRMVGAVDSEPIIMHIKSNFKQKPWTACPIDTNV